MVIYTTNSCINNQDNNFCEELHSYPHSTECILYPLIEKCIPENEMQKRQIQILEEICQNLEKTKKLLDESYVQDGAYFIDLAIFSIKKDIASNNLLNSMNSAT